MHSINLKHSTSLKDGVLSKGKKSQERNGLVSLSSHSYSCSLRRQIICCWIFSQVVCRYACVGILCTQYQQTLTLFILCQNSESVFCHMRCKHPYTQCYSKNKNHKKQNINSVSTTKEATFSFKNDSGKLSSQNKGASQCGWGLCIVCCPRFWCVFHASCGSSLHPDHSPVFWREHAQNHFCRFLCSRERSWGERAPFIQLQEARKHWVSF